MNITLAIIVTVAALVAMAGLAIAIGAMNRAHDRARREGDARLARGAGDGETSAWDRDHSPRGPHEGQA